MQGTNETLEGEKSRNYFIRSKTEGHIKTRPGLIDLVLQKTFLKIIPETIKPNHVTAFRFFCVPFVIYFLLMENYLLAIILLAIAGFSDAIDGAMARTRHQVSDWGKTYDPLADKLLIGSVTALVVSNYISIYLAVIIITIELLLMANAFYKRKVEQKIIQAQYTGKIKMTLQTIGLLALLFHIVYPSSFLLYGATYILYVSVVFALISLFVYKSV